MQRDKAALKEIKQAIMVLKTRLPANLNQLNDCFGLLDIIKQSMQTNSEKNSENEIMGLGTQHNRNNKCPCGSGKNFENCCGNQIIFRSESELFRIQRLFDEGASLRKERCFNQARKRHYPCTGTCA